MYLAIVRGETHHTWRSRTHTANLVTFVTGLFDALSIIFAVWHFQQFHETV
jgi:hypothetical protein